MESNLSTTFQYLGSTENETAVDILVAAFDNPSQTVRAGALGALLNRPDLSGYREVFLRLATFDGKCREIIGERTERLTGAAGKAVQGPDARVAAAACDVVLSYRLYGAISGLVTALGAAKPDRVSLIAKTILRLTETFYGELSGDGDQLTAVTIENLRRQVTSALEVAVGRFYQHRCREPVEAFLMVVKPQNNVLQQILHSTGDANHQAVVDVLTESEQGGVVRLLLSFLDAQHVPQAVRNAFGRRTDAKFAQNLLRTLSSGYSKTAQEMLSRVDHVAWAQPGHPVLRDLDETGQSDAVRFILSTAMSKQHVLKTLEYLLQEGNAGGRHAAAAALEQFECPEANALVVRSLNDPDLQVRARLAAQLRRRQIPGAISLLIRMVDSSSEEVRQAVRENLPEFSVPLFLKNIRNLPEGVVAAVGNLVRKIDADAPALLRAELTCISPVRRRKALEAARAMGVVGELEQTVIELLNDEDHMVRTEAANALATCRTLPSWEALRDALLDNSMTVQGAAERSIEQISRSLMQDSMADNESEMEEAMS